MKTSGSIPFSGVVFDGAVATPRYRQLYAYIRDPILRGALPAGMRLPSSRDLAAELNIARNTVIAAYELLADEEFVEPAPGRGTVVRNIPLLQKTADRIEPRVEHTRGKDRLRMGFALPDIEHFPARTWARVLRNALNQGAAIPSAHLSVAGDARLRQQVCSYLGAYRGVRCQEHQVLITSGGQQALYLAATVLRRFTTAMFMEEPGYIAAREAFLACNYELHPLPVDEAGAVLDTGLLEGTGSRAMYLTPSHQFPLGATLSLERRLCALEWAQRENGWIIEDDYDAEYRYDGEPLTALAGLDEVRRVIYAGTFSKVLSPALRVGYLVVPEQLLEHFLIAKELSDGPAPQLMQYAIADFMQNGYFQAHLRQMRRIYREKRDRLLQLLGEIRPPLAILPNPAGMHVALLLDERHADRNVSLQMAQRGFDVPALSRYYLHAEQARQGLLVGFTSARNTDLADFTASLAETLDATLHGA